MHNSAIDGIIRGTVIHAATTKKGCYDSELKKLFHTSVNSDKDCMSMFEYP